MTELNAVCWEEQGFRERQLQKAFTSFSTDTAEPFLLSITYSAQLPLGAQISYLEAVRLNSSSFTRSRLH